MLAYKMHIYQVVESLKDCSWISFAKDIDIDGIDSSE